MSPSTRAIQYFLSWLCTQPRSHQPQYTQSYSHTTEITQLQFVQQRYNSRFMSRIGRSRPADCLVLFSVCCAIGFPLRGADISGDLGEAQHVAPAVNAQGIQPEVPQQPSTQVAASPNIYIYICPMPRSLPLPQAVVRVCDGGETWGTGPPPCECGGAPSSLCGCGPLPPLHRQGLFETVLGCVEEHLGCFVLRFCMYKWVKPL